MEETRAFGILTGLLKKYGFAVESGQGGMPTAFVATYGTGHPVVGINAEYDCLQGCLRNATRLIPAQCRREPRAGLRP